MNVLDKLATSLNRRDETPNQQLAQNIVNKKDKNAIKELVQNLNNKDKNIQSDCIKVLYEIGKREPAFIAPYVKEFLPLLESTNNRLVWGAMTALDMITAEKPKEVYSVLSTLMEIAAEGSVITRDHYVGILIKLTGMKQYTSKTFPLFIEQLKECPTNQLPMYAEQGMGIIHNSNKKMFIQALLGRLDDMEKESKRKRVERVIKKIQTT